jgi:hypothetical protein
MCNCGGGRRAARNNPSAAPAAPPRSAQPSRSVPVTAPRSNAPTPLKSITIPLSNTRPIIRGKNAINHVLVTEPKNTYDTSLWGPSLWFVLHTLAEFSDRHNVRNRWSDLVRALQISLPCPDCSNHLNQWINTNPYILRNTPEEIHTFTRNWVLTLHNDVNRRLSSTPTEWLPATTPSDKKITWNSSDLAFTYGGDRQYRLNQAEERISTLERYLTSGFILVLRNLVRLLR